MFRSFKIFQMSIVRFFLSVELLSRNLHQFVPDRIIRQWIISLHYFFHKNTYCSKYWNIIHDCNNFDTANNFHSGQMKLTRWGVWIFADFGFFQIEDVRVLVSSFFNRFRELKEHHIYSIRRCLITRRLVREAHIFTVLTPHLSNFKNSHRRYHDTFVHLTWPFWWVSDSCVS